MLDICPLDSLRFAVRVAHVLAHHSFFSAYLTGVGHGCLQEDGAIASCVDKCNRSIRESARSTTFEKYAIKRTHPEFYGAQGNPLVTTVHELGHRRKIIGQKHRSEAVALCAEDGPALRASGATS